MTMSLAAVALAILAGAMGWAASSARQSHRGVQYDRSIAAAEAAGEKVIARLSRDFLYGGPGLVAANVPAYRNVVPTATDSAYWSTWEFNDAAGGVNKTYVRLVGSTNNLSLKSPYAGLRANAAIYNVASHARDRSSIQDVTAGVLQQVQLTTIPIFQFALYSSGDMEVSCGQPFRVTGRAHANKTLYVEPDNALTFESGVTAVANVVFHRAPGDDRNGGMPGGTVDYLQTNQPVFPVDALTLPIGTTNTPEAVRAIIETPPSTGDTNLALAKLRYYNQSDLLLFATNGGIYATSGKFNSFSTPIPAGELAGIITLTNSFRDDRESKTVLPIDVDIGQLAVWSQTNNSLRSALGGAGLPTVMRSVYVVDARSFGAGQLGAVRLVNGRQLPPNGLTVATARPLYVQGDYNQPDPANIGTTNTLTTLPASLAADAISILSTAWSDANSVNPLASRVAAPTTVNAAFLTGVVETTPNKYSGGMENFPRFLEAWGLANVFTYNGSMIKMFPSRYATNSWSLSYYDPPARNWAFDQNFLDMTKLPPLTPQLQLVIRSRWATLAPGQNTAP